MTGPAAVPGLRERTRLAMRAEIATTAINLFITNGFDATTIDDVVAATGVSRRTFFRYFATKEDVVLGYLTDLGDALCAALADRPPEEPVWDALRRAMDTFTRIFLADPARMTAILRLCDDTASVRARHAEKTVHWRRGLTVELANRLGVDPDRDLRPATYAAATIGVLDVVGTAWHGARHDTDVDTLLDEAFAALRGCQPLSQGASGPGEEHGCQPLSQGASGPGEEHGCA